jgi:MAF protein
MPLDQTTVMLRLASASPRRSELLALTGWEQAVLPAEVDETPQEGEAAEALARRLAREKALAASEANAQSAVIAADTVVELDGKILGKPSGPEEARQMLRALRGRSHRVITAIHLLDPVSDREILDACTTEVPMRAYSDAELEAYVASGEPLDKAGGYGIQSQGFQPVDRGRLAGCFANVMGLPLCHVVRSAQHLGLQPARDVPAACQEHLAYDCPVYAQILEAEA